MRHNVSSVVFSMVKLSAVGKSLPVVCCLFNAITACMFCVLKPRQASGKTVVLRVSGV